MSKAKPKITNQKDPFKTQTMNATLKAWDNLWQAATMMEFKKDQVLFYRGHLPYGVYVLVSGGVKLCYETPTGAQALSHFAEFVPYGLDLIAMDVEYPCTAMAESDAKLLFLPKSMITGR